MNNQWDELFVTPKVLTILQYQALSQIICQFNRINTTRKLKLALQKTSQQNEWEENLIKLALISNFYTSGPPAAVWLLTTVTQLQINNLASEQFKVIFILLEDQDIFQNPPNGIKIRDIKQGLNIIAMNQQEQRRRLKMQNMVNKSQLKHLQHKNIKRFKQLCDKFICKNIYSNLKIMKKMMSFHHRSRLNVLRQYFNRLSIFFYEQELKRQEEEMVGYLSKKQIIKRKAFFGWKKILFDT